MRLFAACGLLSVVAWGALYQNEVHDKSGAAITAPRAIDSPDAKYPKLPHGQKRVKGVELLSAVVGTDGRLHDIQVRISLGKEFDEEAVKTLSKWKFQPGTRDGIPVATQLNIELPFKHY